MDRQDLKVLRGKLVDVLASMSSFLSTAQVWRAPIIQPENDTEGEIPGLKNFESSVKREIEFLDKFLAVEDVSPVTISTNAPYYLSVWTEVLAVPGPVMSIGRSFSLSKTHKSALPSVKVDIVAENGRRWVRVNTIKNNRLMMELHEADSYIDGDDSSSDASLDDDTPSSFAPSKASPELDNSVLRMGRALLDAAVQNPFAGTSGRPRVHLRLTRLNPSSEQEGHGHAVDPRIKETIDILTGMGIAVELGERPVPVFTDVSPSYTSSSFTEHLLPTARINLDLSLLIALISDLSHSALPTSSSDALGRFRPLNRKWKKEQASTCSGTDSESDPGEHSRALILQAEQEMRRGLIDEIREKLLISQSPGDKVAFWTTSEAHQRCISIVEKIGGPGERRRAKALFFRSSSGTDGRNEDEIDLFWEESRYPLGFLPGLPVRIITPDLPQSISQFAAKDPFLSRLIQTSRLMLSSSNNSGFGSSAKPPTSRLTPHTVRSLLIGASEAITTLTANRASVKGILREMLNEENIGERSMGEQTAVESAAEAENDVDRYSGKRAWIWVVEPRSLAENMRTDLLTT